MGVGRSGWLRSVRLDHDRANEIAGARLDVTLRCGKNAVLGALRHPKTMAPEVRSHWENHVVQSTLSISVLVKQETVSSYLRRLSLRFLLRWNSPPQLGEWTRRDSNP